MKHIEKCNCSREELDNMVLEGVLEFIGGDLSKYYLAGDYIINSFFIMSKQVLRELLSPIPDVKVRPFISLMDSCNDLESEGLRFVSIGFKEICLDGEVYAVGITERGRKCENLRIIGTKSNPIHLTIELKDLTLLSNLCK